MYCKNCGSENEPSARFCFRCGTALDGPAKPTVSPQTAPPVPEMQPVPDVQGESVAAPVKKRGIRWWQILLVGVAVVIVVLLIFAIVQIAKSATGENPDVPYNKGTITGNVYTNEWANLQFTFPEEFVQQDPSELENDTGEYEFYLLSPRNEMIAVAFEDLPNFSSITADFYLDHLAEWMTETDNGIYTATVIGEHQDIHIAGRIYRSAHFCLDYENPDITLIESVYTLKLGNRMCSIMCMSDSVEQNDAYATQFQAVNIPA